MTMEIIGLMPEQYDDIAGVTVRQAGHDVLNLATKSSNDASDYAAFNRAQIILADNPRRLVALKAKEYISPADAALINTLYEELYQAQSTLLNF